MIGWQLFNCISVVVPEFHCNSIFCPYIEFLGEKKIFHWKIFIIQMFIFLWDSFTSFLFLHLYFHSFITRNSIINFWSGFFCLFVFGNFVYHFSYLFWQTFSSLTWSNMTIFWLCQKRENFWSNQIDEMIFEKNFQWNEMRKHFDFRLLTLSNSHHCHHCHHHQNDKLKLKNF